MECFIAAMALICVTPVDALAQVRQSGNVTPTHVTCWTTSGTVQDCGASTSPFPTTFGVLNGTGSDGICVQSDKSTAAGYQRFCLGTTTSGGALLSTQNFGTATAQGLSLNLNGSPSAIPAVVTPTVSGDAACFNNTTGTIIDCGTPPGSTGLTTYSVRSNGIACDGITDDTTAFKNLSTTIQNAGGKALIIFPADATCLVYNSGQSLSGSMFSLNAVSDVSIQGNGATIRVGGTFTTETLVLFSFNAATRVRYDGLNVTQINPVAPASPSPYGTQVMICANACTDFMLTNTTLTGGQLLFFGATVTGVFIENVQSISSLYGVILDDGAGNTTPGNVVGAVIRNLYCSSCDRTLFLKGVTNLDATVTSLNARANDILISSDNNSTVNESIRLNYKVLARTAGTAGSYIYVGPSSGSTHTNTVYRNIRINLNVDLSGDAAIYPVVQFSKGGASSLGTTYADIVITGRILGIPNAAGNVIDLFTSSSAPWSGETAKNISLENLYASGSATPSFFLDFAPFGGTQTGQMSVRNFIFPGNYTSANGGSEAVLLGCFSATWGNKTCVVQSSNGGTGLFQPAAHNIPIAGGSGTFALAAPIANGVLASTATNVDPAFTSTPALTSLALGGCTIGTDTICVTGTSSTAGTLTNASNAGVLNHIPVINLSSGTGIQSYGVQNTVHTFASGGTNMNSYGYFTINYADVSAGATLNTNGAFIAQSGLAGASPTGTIANLNAFEIIAVNNLTSGSPALTVAASRGIRVRNQGISGAGITSTAAYALYIDAQSGSSSNYAIWYNSASPTILWASGGFDAGSNSDPGAGIINALNGFKSGGTAGLSTTKTVRASGGAADCTLIYTGGLLTGGSC